MDSLHDIMHTQSWMHLFDTKFHVLYEEVVREFYYNIEFSEDGTVNTSVKYVRLYVNEDLLGTFW